MKKGCQLSYSGCFVVWFYDIGTVYQLGSLSALGHFSTPGFDKGISLIDSFVNWTTELLSLQTQLYL